MTALDAVWSELHGRTWQPHGSGHINDTFVTDDRRYLLQKINRTVFVNFEAVMRNLQKVVDHVGPRYLLAPLATNDGAAWYCDGENQVWRLFPFASRTRSFEVLDRSLLLEAAKAFGRFVRDLADFDEQLETAIDGFHDLAGYRQALAKALTNNRGAVALAEEITFAESYPATDFGPSARVIHGDCKVNNLLFEARHDRVAFVVDLDTVMTGHPAWDFGDLVRSAAAGAEEARGAGHLHANSFSEIARGYKRGLDAALEPAVFAAAPGHMSFMLGVRFLTDHLAGNRYFKVTYPEQNLERARAQFALTRQFDAMRGEMERILRSA